MKPVGNTNRKRIVWQDIVPAQPTKKAPVKVRKLRRKIKIVIPTLPIRKIAKNIKHLATKTRRRKIIVVICALAVISVVAFSILYRPATSQDSPAVSSNGGNVVGKPIPGNPTYSLILPSGKSIKELGGGWVRNDKQPSFIYLDKIGSVKIQVSEQPLPESFKDNPAHEVQALATSFNATGKISLGTNTIYIGSYGQDTQRVIFIKNNLLVLITSSGSVNNSQWATYVSSLN
jgi:hypothetical protein